MNHNILQPALPPQIPQQKSGCGCLLNILIGLAVVFFGLAVTAWVVLMHTSVPLGAVVSLIEEAGAKSNLKITGVTGSLSSGVGIEKMKWDGGEITDVRVHYSGLFDFIQGQELILEEVHVGSATITTNFDGNTSETTHEETPVEAATPQVALTGNEEFPLRLIRIDRLSLNKILLTDGATGKTITIPKIEWTGFKAEKGAKLEFGNLVADSDHLVIRTTDAASAGYSKHLEISLLPKLDDRILKPIHLTADLGEKDGKAIIELKAFDGAARFVQRADGSQSLSATGANLADFLDAPLPNGLTMEAELAKPKPGEAKLNVRGGSFLLGKKNFVIEATEVSGPDDNPQGTFLLATCREDGVTYRYELLPKTKGDGKESVKAVLTTTPAMSPEDSMAMLFHERKFQQLSAQEQEKLRRHMAWFSFPK